MTHRDWLIDEENLIKVCKIDLVFGVDKTL